MKNRLHFSSFFYEGSEPYCDDGTSPGSRRLKNISSLQINKFLDLSVSPVAQSVSQNRWVCFKLKWINCISYSNSALASPDVLSCCFRRCPDGRRPDSCEDGSDPWKSGRRPDCQQRDSLEKFGTILSICKRRNLT